MLCRVAAVKSLPIHHHSAGYILFPLGSLNLILKIEYRLSQRANVCVCVGGGGGGGGCVCSLVNSSSAYEENQTESPIFVILCVLCF